MKKKEKLKMMPEIHYGLLETGFTTPQSPNNNEGTYQASSGGTGNTGGAHSGQTDFSRDTYGWQHSEELQYTNWKRNDYNVHWSGGDVIRFAVKD